MMPRLSFYDSMKRDRERERFKLYIIYCERSFSQYMTENIRWPNTEMLTAVKTRNKQSIHLFSIVSSLYLYLYVCVCVDEFVCGLSVCPSTFPNCLLFSLFVSVSCPLSFCLLICLKLFVVH